jgi:hypothetical protein
MSDHITRPRHSMAEVFERWAQEVDRLSQFGALIPAAALILTVLTDVRAVLDAEGDELLAIREANALSRKHPATLRQLVATGRLPQAGRLHAPRVRRRDLANVVGVRGTHYLSSTRRQIALPIINSDDREDSRMSRATP